MKVRLIPPSPAKPLILGDDATRLFISDYRTGLPADVAAWRPYKALYPVFFANGFNASTRAFKVDQEHATAAAAFLFSETHPGLVPLLAVLEITDENGTVYLDAARMGVELIARNGKTTIFAYAFDCGEVRTTITP